MYVCVLHAHLVPVEARTRTTDDCKLPHRRQELNAGPLERQPSLQAKLVFFQVVQNDFKYGIFS